MSAPANLSHASAMDRMYRYTRHVYDLTRKPYLLGRDRLIADLGLGLDAEGTVLELGCGTGRNLIAVARAYPKAKLYGVDISKEMLKSARAAIDRAGLSHRIQVTQGDATTFDPVAAFGVPTFDRVYFSYTLSMVPVWREALARGMEITAPNGRFSVVDFGFCDELGSVSRALLHGWLRLFHVTPRKDLETELIALATRHGRPCRFQRPFGGYAQLGTIGRLSQISSG